MTRAGVRILVAQYYLAAQNFGLLSPSRYAALGFDWFVWAVVCSACNNTTLTAIDYYNRGNTKASNSNFQEAVIDYTEAIRLNPELQEAYSNRGNAKNALGDFTGAISDYTEAIRMNPRNHKN